MPKTIKLAVARHGARADDDPLWASSDQARIWDPPLSAIGREQASSLGDYAASLGVSRLVVSPFERCLQTAAAVARKILEKAAAEEAAEATATEETPAANNSGRRPLPSPLPLIIEIDASVCEVLSRDCMGGKDPPDGADPGLWAWGGNGEREEDDLEWRLLSAATAAGLPRELTSLTPRPSSSSSKKLFASYPERRGEAGTRYLIALASAAARALASAAGAGGAEREEEDDGGGDGEKRESPNQKKEKKDKLSPPPPITMVVTHGEAVVAATRMTSKGREPYAVPPTGVVVLDVFIDDDDDDGGGEDCDGDGEEGSDSSALAASAAVACARWELSEASRGVAFE